MLTLTYTAMDGNGREQTGKLQAESERQAAARLKQKGLFPTSIREAQGRQTHKAGHGKAGFCLKDLTSVNIGAPVVRKKDLTILTRQLAVLLDAGLPLVRALRTLQKQAKKTPGLNRVLCDLADAVEGGSTFSEALNLHPKSFNKLFVNMVRAGEASGAMETVLNRLAGFMEKAARMAGKVKAALVYPSIVLLVALSITSGLMIFIVPKFAKIFREMLSGKPLPGLTVAVIAVSNVMQHYALFLAAGLLVAAFAFRLGRRTQAGGYAVDYILTKIPAVKQLTVKSVVARFSRTLGTLMQSGVGILDALRIVRDTAGNEVFGHAIQAVHDAVKEGEGVSGPLEQTGVFPGMVVSMVEVGEETGALPEMLERVADVYEEEVDRAVEALTSLIEPVMIVGLAVIVGTIVIALFLPLIVLITEVTG